MAQTKVFLGDFFLERNLKNGTTVKRVMGEALSFWNLNLLGIAAHLYTSTIHNLSFN